MDASPVAAFFARSGPALQKVVDEFVAKAVDQAVAAVGCMLDHFREELLAPSAALLQLERRVQALEAAAAEQGARHSRQGHVAHAQRGKVQEVERRIQEVHPQHPTEDI